MIHILGTTKKRKLQHLLETPGKDEEMSVLFNYLTKYSDMENLKKAMQFR